jgi:hypothetical protein
MRLPTGMREVVMHDPDQPVRVLPVHRIGATVAASSRHLEADPTSAGVLVEEELRHLLDRELVRGGWVQVGDVEVEQSEDWLRDVTQYRAVMLVIEDDSPTWRSVRAAIAEDQAWMADPDHEGGDSEL